jgi:branched-chain amino acid transport system ATP-binding protein
VRALRSRPSGAARLNGLSPPERQPCLVVADLRAGYGDAEIVHGVGLRVDPGSIVCLIGPNGSGKSTLLKAVIGLADILDGVVRLQGEDVTGRRTDTILSRGVGVVPQSNHVFAPMSVEDNLKLGMRRGTSPERLEAMYELFPVLRDKRRQRGSELSGGQRQMVACARALIAEPSVLLLDEPSAGLSPAATYDMFESLTAIRAQGVGILLVEQNAIAALEVSDHCLVLADGQARFEGTADEVLGNPSIGKMYLGG